MRLSRWRPRAWCSPAPVLSKATDLGILSMQARLVPLDGGMDAGAWAEQHALRCGGGLQGHLVHVHWLLGFIGQLSSWADDGCGALCAGVCRGPACVQGGFRPAKTWGGAWGAWPVRFRQYLLRRKQEVWSGETLCRRACACCMDALMTLGNWWGKMAAKGSAGV